MISGQKIVPQDIAVGDNAKAQYRGGVESYPERVVGQNIDENFHFTHDDRDAGLGLAAPPRYNIPSTQNFSHHTLVGGDITTQPRSRWFQSLYPNRSLAIKPANGMEEISASPLHTNLGKDESLLADQIQKNISSDNGVREWLENYKTRHNFEILALAEEQNRLLAESRLPMVGIRQQTESEFQESARQSHTPHAPLSSVRGAVNPQGLKPLSEKLDPSGGHTYLPQTSHIGKGAALQEGLPEYMVDKRALMERWPEFVGNHLHAYAYSARERMAQERMQEISLGSFDGPVQPVDNLLSPGKVSAEHAAGTTDISCDHGNEDANIIPDFLLASRTKISDQIPLSNNFEKAKLSQSSGCDGNDEADIIPDFLHASRTNFSYQMPSQSSCDGNEEANIIPDFLLASRTNISCQMPFSDDFENAKQSRSRLPQAVDSGSFKRESEYKLDVSSTQSQTDGDDHHPTTNTNDIAQDLSFTQSQTNGHASLDISSNTGDDDFKPVITRDQSDNLGEILHTNWFEATGSEKGSNDSKCDDDSTEGHQPAANEDDITQTISFGDVVKVKVEDGSNLLLGKVIGQNLDGTLRIRCIKDYPEVPRCRITSLNKRTALGKMGEFSDSVSRLIGSIAEFKSVESELNSEDLSKLLLSSTFLVQSRKEAVSTGVLANKELTTGLCKMMVVFGCLVGYLDLSTNLYASLLLFQSGYVEWCTITFGLIILAAIIAVILVPGIIQPSPPIKSSLIKVVMMKLLSFTQLRLLVETIITLRSPANKQTDGLISTKFVQLMFLTNTQLWTQAFAFMCLYDELDESVHQGLLFSIVCSILLLAFELMELLEQDPKQPLKMVYYIIFHLGEIIVQLVNLFLVFYLLQLYTLYYYVPYFIITRLVIYRCFLNTNGNTTEQTMVESMLAHVMDDDDCLKQHNTMKESELGHPFNNESVEEHKTMKFAKEHNSRKESELEHPPDNESFEQHQTLEEGKFLQLITTVMGAIYFDTTWGSEKSFRASFLWVFCESVTISCCILSGVWKPIDNTIGETLVVYFVCTLWIAMAGKCIFGNLVGRLYFS